MPLEGLAIGTVGFALAAVSGMALGVLWVDATFPSLVGWVLQLHLPLRPAVLLAAATIVVCGLALLAPAHRVARLEPAAVLRH